MSWVDLVRKWVPRRVRYALQRVVPATGLKLRYRRQRDPLAGVTSSDDNSAASPVMFGIIRNACQYHSHYVRACLEMGVPFRVLDLVRSDWLDVVHASGCEVLLAWPDAFLSIWGRMVKDRLEILERHCGYPIVPSCDEIWMYEDKQRMAAWLRANSLPHPHTWVFYDRAEAARFVTDCELPIVFKTTFGAAAAGVRIVRSRRRLRALLRRSFGCGVVTDGGDQRDRQWGSMLLQEYLPEVREWRMVRIGDSFFGHPKGRVGEFHSGSGAVEWETPAVRHLELLYAVTERGGFRSMDVDVFELPDGRLLINELQAVFGASFSVDQLRIDGVAGRFVRRGPEQWEFEPGEFARNACADERIRDALRLGLRRQMPLDSAAASGSATGEARS